MSQQFIDFTHRVVHFASLGHKTQVTFTTREAALRMRFRYYKWRSRSPDVPQAARSVVLSVHGRDLIASLGEDIDIASNAHQFDPLSQQTGAVQIPEFLKQYIQHKPQGTSQSISTEPNDPANDAVKQLFSDSPEKKDAPKAPE